MTTNRLLTASEAAARLNVSRSFLTRHAAELGGVKLGTRLQFTEVGIAAYLDRQRVTAPVVAEREPVAAPKPALRVIGQGAINPRTKRPWDYLERAR